MTIRLDLKITYPSEEAADTVFKAVGPDNAGYAESEMNGSELRFVIKADNAGTLRNAADDLLACIKIAEEAAGLSDRRQDDPGD